MADPLENNLSAAVSTPSSAASGITPDVLKNLTDAEREELLALVEDDLVARPLIPQPGPQQDFMDADADIVIYGGAAWGGKSWALLYKPLEHLRSVQGFNGVLFRRTSTQIRKPGANWDESMGMYPQFGGEPTANTLEWNWPAGGKLKMDGLEYDSSVMDWHSAQVAALLFDELTLFSRKQVFYMLSRNRSTCGVRPYMRAACNADSESWVAEFLAWWIDQDTGFAIPERAGKVRWFHRGASDTLHWADTAEELRAKFGDECDPKSVSFIPAKATDNKIGLQINPGYIANLKALDRVERERLLNGNWKIRAAAGAYFQRSWCKVVDAAPADVRWVRQWDLAATEKTESNDPDWTVGWKMGRQYSTGRFFVAHVERFRHGPHLVRQRMKNVATEDGTSVQVGLAQDPGQAGKDQAQNMIAGLAGFTVKSERETGDIVTRFEPFSAQCEAGNVDFVRGPWLEAVFNELEAFPDGSHDDCAAAAALCFKRLVVSNVVAFARMLGI